MSMIEYESQLIDRAIRRGVMEISGSKITYNIHKKKTYQFTDPEEEVRAETIAFITMEKGYDPKRIETEVVGSHKDFADVVLCKDDACKDPYLVVENKKRSATKSERDEGLAQAFANAISLKSIYAMIDYGDESTLYNVINFPSGERSENVLGDRHSLPENYSEPLTFRLTAGDPENDIKAATASQISSAIKRAHSIIWAGGKRDPLSAFDEWSKLMLAKVRDERYAKNGEARRFQVGVGESFVSTASRIHELFKAATKKDKTIFPDEVDIELPDKKIVDVVRALQNISFIDTDADVIGNAFEDFFGSVFRGELGQYFTMRPVARFVVGMLEPDCDDYILDPTCGSGGFLLEVLLQVWRRVDREFEGRSDIEKVKNDFALDNVYGIEIHAVLARICKISLLLHHDGHTNIEADKSCLSPTLRKSLLREHRSFDIVVGNPPFGSSIEKDDEDQLDGRSLDDYEVSKGKSKIQSEQVILEHSINMLKPGGWLGMVLPDGVLNNSGQQSNCPKTREYLFQNGRVKAVVSLPDYAFRRSGATNKTSILIYQKFETSEKNRLQRVMAADESIEVDEALVKSGLDYAIFMAEPIFIGYTPSGQFDSRNDLYIRGNDDDLAHDQTGSILGEWRSFKAGLPISDRRCCQFLASDVWGAHGSHRLDPKYHIYKAHASDCIPDGWLSERLGKVVERRKDQVDFSRRLDDEFVVMTLSQTGEIHKREAGKGKNYPEWIGMYFEDSSSRWFQAKAGDIVYSGIDIWKGVIALVEDEFDGAIVTSEYPILKVVDDRVDPAFLAILLRTGHFRKVFRAINTGHSNRRRTQESDFNDVLVFFPSLAEQREWVDKFISAKEARRNAESTIVSHNLSLNALLGTEEEYEFDDDPGLLNE